ncbi:MAG TPA: hypothetical protein EYQ18_09815 [Candidatus Handelsmanbacteria bacterium]|nr:hypothetical protein [Candidatus Handelsmanbacteria bacterium]
MGTGTSPSACFLAERGFNADAIDLIIDSYCLQGIATVKSRLKPDGYALICTVMFDNIKSPPLKKPCVAPQPDLGNFSRFG